MIPEQLNPVKSLKNISFTNDNNTKRVGGD